MVTRIARTLSKERAEDLQCIVAAIDCRVQHYLFIKTLMSVATAALAALILLVGRVDFIIFSALLIFFLNYIPTFGSLLGTIFPVLITFLRYGFCLRLVLVTAGLMVMQFVMGNVLEPQVMGRSLEPFADRHPAFPDLLGLAVGRGRHVPGRAPHLGPEDHL